MSDYSGIIDQKIFSKLCNDFFIIEPCFSIYRIEEKKDIDTFRISPSYFDTKKVISQDIDFMLFNTLWGILELIYKDDKFSLLAADIANFLAELDYAILYKKQKTWSLKKDDIESARSRYIKHIEIAQAKLSIYFKEYLEYKKTEQLAKISNVSYLYTQNQLMIDEIRKFGIDTRYYFYYDGVYEIYWSVNNMLILNLHTADMAELKSRRDKTLELFKSLENNNPWRLFKYIILITILVVLIYWIL